MSRLFKDDTTTPIVRYGAERVIVASFQRTWWGCKSEIYFDSGGSHTNYTTGVVGEKCAEIEDFFVKNMKEVPTDCLSSTSGDKLNIR